MKFPTVSTLAAHLVRVNNECEADTDVRLQVTETGWAVHTGDPSYDTDHHGHWASDALPGRQVGFAEMKWARDMAHRLLDQAEDSAAQES